MCARLRLRARTFMCAMSKEPYTQLKEPHLPAKEPYQHAKEPYHPANPAPTGLIGGPPSIFTLMTISMNHMNV